MYVTSLLASDHEMRRTKQQSAETRRQIIAAARRVFAERGVTRSTLDHVAAAANVTRGAIYWHFDDKLALFEAMREQVSLPLVDRIDFTLLNAARADPLDAVEAFLRDLFASIDTDPVARQTFEITLLKCEYVDEFEAERTRQVKRSGELLAKLTATYRRARRGGLLRRDLTPDTAALETCAFATGLFRLCLIDRKGALARSRVDGLIRTHVRGFRAV
jgi:TetR/AcrR family acrAB operon transcriptional repressor